MLNNISLHEILTRHIPIEAVDEVINLIIRYRIKVVITKSRLSKFGDYRPPQKGKGHRISINHDLNRYAFLITFLHEAAHLVAWVNYQGRILPHGKEWKKEFKNLLLYFIERKLFPDDIVKTLNISIDNLPATSCTDVNLSRVLRKYNYTDVNFNYLEELPSQCVFKMKNGKQFIKGIRLRKRFKCIEYTTKKIYLIDPLTEVILSESA